MITGYQRELTYRRNDGSFSAFGNQDKDGQPLADRLRAEDLRPGEGPDLHRRDGPGAGAGLDRQAPEGRRLLRAGGLRPPPGDAGRAPGQDGPHRLRGHRAAGGRGQGSAGQGHRATWRASSTRSTTPTRWPSPPTPWSWPRARSRDAAHDKLMAMAEEDENGLYWGSEIVPLLENESPRAMAPMPAGIQQSTGDRDDRLRDPGPRRARRPPQRRSGGALARHPAQRLRRLRLHAGHGGRPAGAHGARGRRRRRRRPHGHDRRRQRDEDGQDQPGELRRAADGRAARRRPDQRAGRGQGPGGAPAGPPLQRPGRRDAGDRLRDRRRLRHRRGGGERPDHDRHQRDASPRRSL